MRRTKGILLALLVYTTLTSVGYANPVTPGDTIPKITVTPIALNFGRVSVGAAKQLSVVITNSSTAALTLTDSVGQLSSPFVADSGYGPASLDSGVSKRVYISFHPLYSGQFSDSLVITSNADSAHQRIIVYLSGTGFIPDTVARILVTPTIVDFGIVYTGQSNPKTVTIKNVTNTGLQLKGNVLNAHLPFAVTVGLGNFVLDSGRSKDIIIQCAPTDTGTFRDSIIINSNADDANDHIVVILRVTVHSADELLPKMTLSTTTLDFGTLVIHSTEELTLGLTIKNVSDTQRTLLVNLLFPNQPFTVTGANDHLELTRFQAQDLVVHFSPKTLGDYKDSIIVISNSAKSRIPVYLKASVITSQGVSPGAEVALRSVRVYPNPSASMMLVRFSSVDNGVARCVLYDVTGRKLLSSEATIVEAGENAISLNVSEIPSGVYEGRIEGIAGAKNFKVVISR